VCANIPSGAFTGTFTGVFVGAFTGVFTGVFAGVFAGVFTIAKKKGLHCDRHPVIDVIVATYDGDRD
jgi:hypothetical protein